MQATLPNKELSQLAPGDTIFYHLKPDDLPVDPAKEWSGVITQVYRQIRIVIVRVTTKDFEGEEEEVDFQQIVKVEKKDAQNPRN